MLSAIIQCLPLIRKETNADRRQILVDICVSAYPDLCPWQLKRALLEQQEKADDGPVKNGVKNDLRDLYYYYLSSLLHPHDGHGTARHDAGLVEVRKECPLSLSPLFLVAVADSVLFLHNRNGASCRWMPAKLT